MINFLQKNKGLIIFATLVVLSFLLFFFQLNSFNFLNNIEMNYVSVASEMIKSHNIFAPTLNGHLFFEKPPLYTYMTALCLKFCHSTNAIKYIVCAFATFISLFIYFICAKFISRKYGFLTALIFMTSSGFLIFSKIAFFEIIFSIFITLSILVGICTIFVKEKNQKFLWWIMYIISAISTMTGGITGLSLPLISLFFINLFTGNIKNFFKPLHIGIGLLLFSLITIPWHVIMLKIHKFQFFREYFLNSHCGTIFHLQNVSSAQSFDYYIWILLFAFLPWIVFLIPNMIHAYFIHRQNMKNYLILRGFKFDFIKYFNLSKNLEKMLIINIIYFISLFLYLSLQKVKIPEFILFVLCPSAFIAAYFWFKYINDKIFEKSIKFAALIINLVLFCFAFITYFLPYFSDGVVKEYAMDFQLPLSILFITVSILSTIFLFAKKKFILFLLYAGLMIGISICILYKAPF